MRCSEEFVKLCEEKFKSPFIVERQGKEVTEICAYVPEEKEIGIDMYVLIRYWEPNSGQVLVKFALPSGAVYEANRDFSYALECAFRKLCFKYAAILYDEYAIGIASNVVEHLHLDKYDEILSISGLKVYIPSSKEIPYCHVIVKDIRDNKYIVYLTEDGEAFSCHPFSTKLQRLILCNHKEIVEAYKNNLSITSNDDTNIKYYI